MSRYAWRVPGFNSKYCMLTIPGVSSTDTLAGIQGC